MVASGQLDGVVDVEGRGETEYKFVFHPKRIEEAGTYFYAISVRHLEGATGEEVLDYAESMPFAIK